MQIPTGGLNVVDITEAVEVPIFWSLAAAIAQLCSALAAI